MCYHKKNSDRFLILILNENNIRGLMTHELQGITPYLKTGFTRDCGDLFEKDNKTCNKP